MTTGQYKDIAEFGHSMHHLLDEMIEAIEGEKDLQVFAKTQVDMHHWKSELRRLEYEPGSTTITPRDRKVFALALAMAQKLMGDTYHKHEWARLEESDIFPVSARV